MAGYIGNKAVGINVTTGDILGDVGVGGNIDVDGISNLDVVDIDGAVNMATTALVTGVLTTTAATVFNGGFAAGGVGTFADGSAGAPSITNTGDVNTGIFFPAADTIAFAEGGAEAMRIASTGDVAIGSTTPEANTNFVALTIGPGASTGGGQVYVESSSVRAVFGADNNGSDPKTVMGTTTDHPIVFFQNNSGVGRFDSSGNLLVGKAATGIGTAGIQAEATGQLNVTQSGNTVIRANRLANDGTVIGILQANTEEGTISVSGGTVSYNAFSGSHWSRLTDNSEPTILKGTLIETIDEMCDWYQAQFTVLATTKVNEEGDTVEDVAAYTLKESIALPDGASVGDTISHISNDVTYSATIVKENDNKHPKCKISNTADSVRIYGVFAAWDSDEDTVNDMYVTAVGTHVVRVHGGQTISAGNLLVSNGDGTAKVQDDDIIRSKTLGKVLTNIKQETYADNSYTVPCALYCG